MLQRRFPVSPGLLLVAIHKHISHFTILAKSTLYILSALIYSQFAFTTAIKILLL